MLTIRIGSVQAGDGGEYIGRAFREHGASPLANPYRITGQHNRAWAIEEYRTWLWGRMKAGDRAVLDELGRLLRLALQPEGVTLVCWCRGVGQTEPACHGDVVKAALEWLAGDEAVQTALLKLDAELSSIG